MKLSSKVKILLDNDIVREVKGLEYEVKGVPLKLVLHESIDAWEENILKVSEKTTGLGMCVIKDIPINKLTKEDVDIAVKEFIKEHGMQAIQKVLDETPTLDERQ